MTACGASSVQETTKAAAADTGAADTEAAADTKAADTEAAGGAMEGAIDVISREDGSGTRAPSSSFSV